MSDKKDKREVPDFVKTKKSLKRQRERAQEENEVESIADELEESNYELDSRTLNKLRRK